MKYNSFLIVGGAGFVGSHVVDALVKAGAEKVVVLDNFFLGKMENLEWAMANGKVKVYREDARYITAVQNILDLEKPDVVYDLAVKPLPYSFIDPESAYMTSIEIAQNLALTLRRGSYGKLIHFSSSEAYGNAKKIPMSESHPLDPTTPYGAGKAAADLLLQSYVHLFKLDITILRPFNMYGPRQNIGAYSAIIPVTIRRILNGEWPVLEGDGIQTRDFTYVGDVADYAVQILSEQDVPRGHPINVGQGVEYRIGDVLKTVCNAMDYPLDSIKSAPARPGDIRHHRADISLASGLGYAPKMSLQDGIEKTVKWIRECFKASS